MTKKEIKDFFERQEWIFAKTFAKTFPHEYILKERLKHGDKKVFVEVIKYMRANGKKEHFFRKEFIYFYLDGKKYWDNGNSLKDTRIINRVSIDNNLIRNKELL